MDPVQEPDDLLRARLVTETATIEWTALQRFFAQGRVMQVQAGTDLVEVAFALSRDRRDRMESWLGDARVAPVSDAQASAWVDADASVWCVVVKPWVLVQDRAHHAGHRGPAGEPAEP